MAIGGRQGHCCVHGLNLAGESKATPQYSNQHVFTLKSPPFSHLENTVHYPLSAAHKTPLRYLFCYMD